MFPAQVPALIVSVAGRGVGFCALALTVALTAVLI